MIGCVWKSLEVPKLVEDFFYWCGAWR